MHPAADRRRPTRELRDAAASAWSVVTVAFLLALAGAFFFADPLLNGLARRLKA